MSEQFCKRCGYIEESHFGTGRASADVAVCDRFTPADDPDAESVVEQGPFLPCPICRGVEGCDHAIPERRRAYLQLSSRLAEAEELINSADEICLKEPDKGRAVVLKLNGNGKWWVCFDDSRGMVSDRKDYDSALAAFQGYKYPKGENL